MPPKLIALLCQLTFIVVTPTLLIAQSTADGLSHVIEIEVPAPALVGNLLGTPTKQMAAIYLPPSYRQQPHRRYPVVYLLHGIFDDYGVWLDNVQVPARLDRLISDGVVPELVVVMPNGGNRYGGGFYRNSPVSGAWADYIADDLVSFVDTQFRTIASENSRAIVGHSMGGYGALNLAMSRPNVFSSVWALSPCCLAVNDDFSFGNDAWKRASKVATMEELQQLFDDSDYYPVAAIGVITAFSSLPGSPPIYANFPFEIIRGEVVLDNDAYDRHLDSFPVREVRKSRSALRNLRGLGLSVGLGDQFLHIPTGTMEFSQILGAERIPHTLDVYVGDHRNQIGERLESAVLPWIGQRLDVTY